MNTYRLVVKREGQAMSYYSDDRGGHENFLSTPIIIIITHCSSLPYIEIDIHVHEHSHNMYKYAHSSDKQHMYIHN